MFHSFILAHIIVAIHLPHSVESFKCSAVLFTDRHGPIVFEHCRRFLTLRMFPQ